MAALDTTFSGFAHEIDASLINGMNDVIASGIAAVHPMVTAALSLYVVTYFVMVIKGQADVGSAIDAAIRAVLITSLLKVDTYNSYVRDFFFTDMPNTIAAAIHGPRVAIDSAHQFDVMWSGVLNYQGFALGLATSWYQFTDRAFIIIVTWLIYAALWVDFLVWYAARIFMALTIALGVFMLILFMWRITAQWAVQWVGKLVSLTILGAVSSILLRLLMVHMTNSLITLGVMSSNFNSGMDLTMVENQYANVGGLMWAGAVLMLVLPSAFAFGSSIGSGVQSLSSSALALGGQGASLGRGIVGASGRSGELLGRRMAGRRI
jgi:type IV secretory pathway VirB6-like protein